MEDMSRYKIINTDIFTVNTDFLDKLDNYVIKNNIRRHHNIIIPMNVLRNYG